VNSTRQVLQHGDSFATATQSGLDWLQTNRSNVIRACLAGLALIVVIVAAAVIYTERKAAATSAFAAAMQTYSTPVADAGQPTPPGMKTFPTAADRAKAANPEFVETAKKYGSFEDGENARYFAGLTYEEMGQNAQAEAELRKAADVRNANVASLAKLALANLLGQSGQSGEAVKLYQQIIAKPTTAVPAATAQLQMAAMYEATGNTDAANRIYTAIKDKDKDSPAAEIAAERLAGPAGPGQPGAAGRR
jgi:tetratricopeptide (TPR) repeat protein